MPQTARLMEMDDVRRVYRGWIKSPPAHWMSQRLASAWGAYKPARKALTAEDAAGAESLASAFPDGIIR